MKVIATVLSSGKTLLLLSVFLLIAFAALFYVDRQVKESARRLSTLKINAERIQNLDSAGTSAVRLAASLESDRYIISYQDFQDAKYALLEENLKFIENATIREALEEMEEVQGDIEDAESEAIALIDEEQWEDALELVVEPAFRRQKGIYRSRLSAALRGMIQQSQGQSEQANMLAQAIQYGVLGTFLLLALIGFVYSREMKKSLLRQSELAINLEDANQNLEQRVSDRTAELEENQTLLNTLVNSLPAVVFLKSSDGRFKLINRQYETLYGRSQEELFDKTLYDFHPPDIAKNLEALDLELIAARDILAREHEVVQDGKTVTLNSVMFPVFDRNDTLTMFGGIEIDITERKQMEVELVEAREAAESAAAAKAEFLATMSHEIRTPMNGVMSMAEILDQTTLSLDQRSMTRTIRQSADALLRVINDILDFSKIEAGKLDIEHIPFDMAEVIQSTADLLAPRAEESALDLIVDIDLDIPRSLLGDPTRIRQIMLNLGSNAIKFTAEGHVEFRVRRVARNGAVRVRIEVTDTGIGLTDEQKGKLFQAFAQADTSTSRKFGGTGLGLSICKRLCEMMGGEIGVDTVPEEGSTFWFELPFDVVEEAGHAPSEDISEAAVLLVGYATREASILQRYLRHGGVRKIGEAFAALTATPSLEDALEQLGGAPSLILMNGKPGLHGIGVELDALAQQMETRGAPIVISAPHTLASTLGATSLARDQLKLLSTITAPQRVERLWHLAAVALGKAELGRDGSAQDAAVVVFTPPSIEEARLANAVILVAEDNETNRIVIRRVLARLGFAFEIAEDGAAALELYQDRAFGMLLTDFHMPEMDGFELTAAIRRQEADAAEGARLPIIALTADALPDTEQQCLDAGMDGYLRKPIEMVRLEAALETHLPQALTLRAVFEESPGEIPMAVPAPNPAVDAAHTAVTNVDRSIFDIAQLEDSFGAYDSETAAFVNDFLNTLEQRVADIASVLEQGEVGEARDTAHAMRGAANSVGAKRMGQILGDIQDRLDDDDRDTAMLFTQLLPQTFEEFKETATRLNRFFL